MIDSSGVPGGFDGMNMRSAAFLAEDDIRLSLLIAIYPQRVRNGWSLKQVSEELDSLEMLYYEGYEEV